MAGSSEGAIAAQSEGVRAKTHEGATCWPGLQAICAIARFHQVAGDPAALAHELGLGLHEEAGEEEILRAARHLGLKARRSQSSHDRLAFVPCPAIALTHGADGAKRYEIIAQCDGKRMLVLDVTQPASRPGIELVEVFNQRWSGGLILVASRASLVGGLARFDFSWFIPAIVRYRRLLGEVLLVSLFLQLFALASPLFFQVVMDKVLVHRGFTTLDVIVAGLVVVVVFESLLSGLRAYIFSHTTNRIDVELGARLFRHLVQLPLAYFQARRVGDSVARVRELENIRAKRAASWWTGSTSVSSTLRSCAARDQSDRHRPRGRRGEPGLQPGRQCPAGQNLHRHRCG